MITEVVKPKPFTERREQMKSNTFHMSMLFDFYGELLTDKQKETLEKFDDCYAELTDINEREIFVYAFRLGARIAIEVLSPAFNA